MTTQSGLRKRIDPSFQLLQLELSFVRFVLNGEDEALDEVATDLEVAYEGAQASYYTLESAIKAAAMSGDDLTERRMTSLRTACANYLEACICKAVFYSRAGKPVKAALMAHLCWKLY